MTASNRWALIVGGLAAGGVLLGAIIWQNAHPDTPIPPIAKLTQPPTLNPPKSVPTPAPDKTVKAPPPDSKGAGLVKGPPPPPEPASGHGEPPHFDVVRVEPSGDAVLAGKGDPNAKVALLSSGKVLTETKADQTGQFVLMPPALKPGDYDLSLRQTPGGQSASDANKGASDSKQTIAVSVPAKPNGDVVVALAEPGKPTKLLAGPPEAKPATKPAPTVANAPPPPTAPSASTALAKPETAKPETAVAPPGPLKPAGPDLAIRSVELENGTGFFASGVATAGTRVQVYLNEVHLAEVVAGRSHDWSVTVKRGLAAGHYIVRADASGDGRTVTARVEVPFDVPEAMAAKMPAKPAEATEPPKVAEAAEPPAEMPKDFGKPDAPPATVASRMPHEAPPVKQPKPAEVAATPVPTPPEEMPTDLGKPNEAPASVASRIPHEPPPAKVAEQPKPEPPKAEETKTAEAEKPASSPSVLARSTPPEPPAEVPTPRPDVAAAAKAKSDAAPSVAPPVLAVAPPVPPEQRPAPPAVDTAVSPPRPAQAPPTLAAAPPQVSTPQVTTPKAPSPDPGPAPPVPDAANAVIEAVETIKVVRGDNLWNISRDRLGGGYRYTRIYQANNDQIRDPKMIYPGQVFVMPSQEVAK